MPMPTTKTHTIEARHRELLNHLRRLPLGTSEGLWNGRRYGATLSASVDLKRWSLFAEERAGRDIVSFNLYVLSDGTVLLKPCEMATEKVVRFVREYAPEIAADGRAS